jgi:hypothetical protein
MTLWKGMGFSAVYMPDNTYHAVQGQLQLHGTTVHDINISGRPLYRDCRRSGWTCAGWSRDRATTCNVRV